MALGHGRGALSPLSFYVPLTPSGDVDVSETLVALVPDEWQPEEDVFFLQSLLPDDPLEGILALFDEPGLEDYPEPDYLAQFLDEPVVINDDPEARVALFDDYQDEEREPDFFAQFLDVPDVVPAVPKPDPGGRPYRGFNLEDWKRNRKPLKDLEDDLEALYWELTNPQAPAEIQAEAARIVRPFTLTEQEIIAPSAVNWKALIEQVEAIQALYALGREEDDIEYLLLNS